MGACLAVEGATSTTIFESYVEQVLAPTLKSGQVIVMDNLSAHKGERVRELIEARGCELLYLPPYSPDFNPIEEAFAKIKGLCCARRRHEAAKPLWKPWGGRSRRSARWTQVLSSNIAAIVYPSIFYETCCKLFLAEQCDGATPPGPMHPSNDRSTMRIAEQNHSRPLDRASRGPGPEARAPTRRARRNRSASPRPRTRARDGRIQEGVVCGGTTGTVSRASCSPPQWSTHVPRGPRS
jgi:transposase